MLIKRSLRPNYIVEGNSNRRESNTAKNFQSKTAMQPEISKKRSKSHRQQEIQKKR